MADSREIYLAACGEIADQFRTMGFKYRRSRPSMTKRLDELTFAVSFQSDFRNRLLPPTPKTPESRTSGSLLVSREEYERELVEYGSVSLLVAVGVSDKAVNQWRLSLRNPIRTLDGIAGSYLGHLMTPPQWLDVNLANIAHRTSRIHAVAELIRTVGLPFFEQFTHPHRVVADLLKGPNPGMSIELALEYVCCYGTLSDGRALLNRVLNENPDYLRDGYRDGIKEYRASGLPAPNTIVGGTGRQLAFAALALGLEPA